MLGLFWGAWFICAIFTAVIASSRGRNGFGWFVLGALFGIFALIAAAAMPVIQKTPRAADGPAPRPRGPGEHPLRVCADCGTYFPKDLEACPRCGVK